ncbi:hypothetical protein EME01_08070 [Sinorhizobium meliloti]|nr:hypothetical protein EME01_08070 [Sinorhizobium meliloti]
MKPTSVQLFRGTLSPLQVTLVDPPAAGNAKARIAPLLGLNPRTNPLPAGGERVRRPRRIASSKGE